MSKLPKLKGINPVAASPSRSYSEGGIRVVRLSRLLRLSLPSLFICALPKKAIGFSFEKGGFGALVGSLLVCSSLMIGYVLSGVIGLFAFPLSVWLLGATGALMIYNSAGMGIAFVKSLCSSCRLLPVIEEHEALHLAGFERDEDVWNLMRKRHSCKTLSLDGDPGICSFCPIPNRLKEH
jgi:hypothetical protein